MFLVSHSFRYAIGCQELFQVGPEASHEEIFKAFMKPRLTGCISDLIMVLNSSVNIFIYCVKDKQFRYLALRTLGLAKAYQVKGEILPTRRNSTLSFSNRLSRQLSTRLKAQLSVSSTIKSTMTNVSSLSNLSTNKSCNSGNSQSNSDNDISNTTPLCLKQSYPW